MDSLSNILKSLTGVVTQLTSLVVAIVALYTAWNSWEQAKIANHRSTQVANSVALDSAGHDLAPASTAGAAPSAAAAPTASTMSAPAAVANYIVQLATYQRANCQTAVQEIVSYGTAFAPAAATLWTDPAKAYAIVGVKTNTLTEAHAAQDKARALSQNPAQAGNDLGNARVRKSPPWIPFGACTGDAGAG